MLKGDESLLDSLLFAFGLEKGSNTFYQKASERVDDPKIKEFFDAMAEVQNGNMANIRLIYCGLDNEACPVTIEEFKDAVPGPYSEGSKLLEDTLRELDVPLLEEVDAVRIAVKHDTLAYSFYEKAGRMMKDSTARVMFQNLAEEKKKHLAGLNNRLNALGGK